MSEDLEGLKVYVAMACRVLARGVSAFGKSHAGATTPRARASPCGRSGTSAQGISESSRHCAPHAAQRRGLLHRRREVERRPGDGIVPGGVIVDPALPHHICSSTWHCACRGDCNLCTNGLHSDVVTQTPGLADAVRRSNEIYLELIG